MPCDNRSQFPSRVQMLTLLMRFRLEKAASPIDPAVAVNPGMMNRVPEKVYTRPVDAVNGLFQSPAGTS